MIIRFVYLLSLLWLPYSLIGQTHQTIDLVKLYKSAKPVVVNRMAEIVSDSEGAYLKVSESRMEGIVWLPFEGFKCGTIEIKMRGKDVFQRSFIGIAFQGINDSVYDAVYCRPFNFFAIDSARRAHAVQYISHPNFTWDKLRKERNGVFEKEIINPPNPNEWFTLKLIITDKNVKAYINNASQASLIVKTLSDRISGKIGLFTADSSGGDFKTISINKMD